MAPRASPTRIIILFVGIALLSSIDAANVINLCFGGILGDVPEGLQPCGAATTPTPTRTPSRSRSPSPSNSPSPSQLPPTSGCYSVAVGGTAVFAPTFASFHSVTETSSSSGTSSNGGYNFGPASTSSFPVSLTMSNAGVFYYYCSIHPSSMHATVHVGQSCP